MKLKNKWLIGAVIGVGVSIASTSCVDDIKFGDSFLEKAPGGSVTRIQFLIMPNILVSF